MNDTTGSPCTDFQVNRWAPNICCICFLHKNRHSISLSSFPTAISNPIPFLKESTSSSVSSSSSYESIDNLKSNYLLQNRKSAQLQLLSPTLLSLSTTSEKPPLTFSIEKDKPIEKSLPLYFSKDNQNNNLEINKTHNNNNNSSATKMNIIKEHVKLTTLTPTKVISIGRKLEVSPIASPIKQLPLKVENKEDDKIKNSTTSSSSSSSSITTTSSLKSNQCKEFLMHQWRPNICLYCFLPKSKHTTTTTTTTTTTSLSSNIQSTTISTTTTTITTSTKPQNATISSTTSGSNKPHPILLKSKSLPPKLLPKLSQASLDLSFINNNNNNHINLPSYKLLLTPPPSLPTLKPILISKSTISEPIEQLNNTTSTSTTQNFKSESNDSTKRFSITISTSTSKTSILSPTLISSTNSNNNSNENLENLISNSNALLLDNLIEEKPTSKRNSGIIQPLRLKSFSFSTAVQPSTFDDDPFKDFEDLVDDDDDFDLMDKNETFLTITTPSQTTIVSNTTTILQSPRIIEKTTTTTSSIIPTLNNNNNNSNDNLNTNNNNSLLPSTTSSTTKTTKRRSIKMDQFKEKEDDWDQGMDLTSFLKKQRKKASKKSTSGKSSGSGGLDIFSDFSYCSNKFMEISSVKEEAQRQSVDFGGGIHPNAFEAFKGILEAKQKQISKAFERNKIDQQDCEKLGDELNSVKDLLHTLMENFNKNPPVISLQNTKDIHKDIQDLNNQSQLQSICVSDNNNNFD